MFQTSLMEISQRLLEARTVLIYPHINMDGDALGSSVSVCKAIRQMGKESYVIIEEAPPANLLFMDKGYCVENNDGDMLSSLCKEADISLCIDCGDEGRVGNRLEKCLNAKETICIDHHHTGKLFCRLNHVEEDAAATGEIIFQLLKEMKVEPDKEIGEALFAAISTDTGKFQYTNTRGLTHKITAELYDWGIDANYVSVQLYQNDSVGKKLISAQALSHMEIVADGKAAISYVTCKMADSLNIPMSDTEGIVDELRNIAGVELAAFLKEKGAEEINVSLRAKTVGNVADIAGKYNGGGHIKAAGCTLYMPMGQALEVMKNELAEAVKRLNL